MRSKVTSQPAVEPVTLDELKSSLRITRNAEDALLTQYIVDARLLVERLTGRKLITQTITAYYDGACGGKGLPWWSGTMTGSESFLSGGQSLTLEFAPVQSVTSLEAVEADNSENTISATTYYLDNYDDDMQAHIRAENGITPGSRNENNLKAVYVAGYGSAGSNVPSAIRRAIITLAGALYSNRGDCDGTTCADQCGATKMIGPYVIKHA